VVVCSISDGPGKNEVVVQDASTHPTLNDLGLPISGRIGYLGHIGTSQTDFFLAIVGHTSLNLEWIHADAEKADDNWGFFDVCNLYIVH
jgi:hypothetical protein